MGWDGPIFDTMLAAALLQPDLYKGLNEVASLYLDLPRWKHKADDDDVEYNLLDAKYEFELYEILSELLREQGMEKLFNNTMMPALRVLTRMTKRGLLIDDAARGEWLGRLTNRQGELLQTWSTFTTKCEPGSPQQLVKLLYGDWGLPLKRQRKSGTATTERSALYELLADLEADSPYRPALECLIEYKKNDKLLSSYAKKGPSDDGCVHPYYLPVSKDSDDEDTGKGMAGTGRIQARDPNIQQLPPDARYIVIPRPGMVLVSFDFKQLELRIAAALSGDRALSDDLELGIFERVMERLGCDRTRAKNIVYGTLYGGGPGALQHALRARGVKTTLKECKYMQAQLAANYPTLWAWRAHVANTAKAQRFLRNPYERVRYFYDKGKDRAAALDYLPQSTAADVVWSDFYSLDACLTRHGGAILATVHDEALTEVPESPELRDGAIVACLEVLQRKREELGVSLPVGVKWSSKNWRDMEPWQSN
jgi:DNA polymerase-1